MTTALLERPLQREDHRSSPPSVLSRGMYGFFIPWKDLGSGKYHQGVFYNDGPVKFRAYFKEVGNPKAGFRPVVGIDGLGFIAMTNSLYEDMEALRTPGVNGIIRIIDTPGDKRSDNERKAFDLPEYEYPGLPRATDISRKLLPEEKLKEYTLQRPLSEMRH